MRSFHLRSESRPRVAGPLEVIVLGQRDVPIPGQVATLSGEELRLLLKTAVHPGAAVRIDVDGTVLLGEVCYCMPEEGAHAVGVHLQHAITLSDELARLMQRLLGDSSPPDLSCANIPSWYQRIDSAGHRGVRS